MLDPAKKTSHADTYLQANKKHGDTCNGEEAANVVDLAQDSRAGHSIDVVTWWWFVAERDTDQTDEVPDSSDTKDPAPGRMLLKFLNVDEIRHEGNDAEGDECQADTSPFDRGDFCDTVDGRQY